MPAAAIDLFHAHSRNMIPADGGYLVLFPGDSNRQSVVCEIVAISSVASVQLQATGLAFNARASGLTISSDGRINAVAVPSPFTLRPPAGKAGAFLFPRGDRALPALIMFLEKTLADESGDEAAAAQRTAEEIAARLEAL